jgi:hypothetical protein
VVGVSYSRVRGMVVVVGVCVCLALPPEVYGTEPRFDIENLDAVCMYPCLNMLVIVCCGIPKVGVEPSMVVQL